MAASLSNPSGEVPDLVASNVKDSNAASSGYQTVVLWFPAKRDNLQEDK